MRARRLPGNPIIRPEMHPALDNINGPSLIRAPDWLPRRLARYYLYFAHHSGDGIRLALADELSGPWRLHDPRSLPLEDTPCFGHIASPDIIVEPESRRLRMYYHGPYNPPMRVPYPALRGVVGPQQSFVALSDDGLHWRSLGEAFGPSYFRVWRYRDWWYAWAMPGVIYRSADGLGDWEAGPLLAPYAGGHDGTKVRHAALRLRGDIVQIFYSIAGDLPERILLSEVDLRPDWRSWRSSPARALLQPEEDYEGADRPLLRSRRGAAPGRVRQLRDPCIYEEDGRCFLLYSCAGESGIAVAEVLDESP